MIAANYHGNHWPDPIEFIYRGQERTKKDHDVIDAASSDKVVRQEIQRLGRDLLQEMEKNELRLEASSKNETPKKASLFSRFYEWLHGTERNSRLQCDMDLAFDRLGEAQTIRSRIAFLSKVAEVYEKNAARFCDVTQDAFAHEMQIQSGWSWWR